MLFFPAWITIRENDLWDPYLLMTSRDDCGDLSGESASHGHIDHILNLEEQNIKGTHKCGQILIFFY